MQKFILLEDIDVKGGEIDESIGGNTNHRSYSGL